MTTITTVGEEDLADLLPLMRAYCDFYETSPSDGALLALMHACLADAESTGAQLIARDPTGVALGFATIYWTWSSTRAIPVAVMNDLFVAPAGRGANLGRSLIDACAHLARERGVSVLEWMTAPDNVRARRVYDATPAERSDWVSYDWSLDPAASTTAAPSDA